MKKSQMVFIKLIVNGEILRNIIKTKKLISIRRCKYLSKLYILLVYNLYKNKFSNFFNFSYIKDFKIKKFSELKYIFNLLFGNLNPNKNLKFLLFILLHYENSNNLKNFKHRLKFTNKINKIIYHFKKIILPYKSS